MARVRFNNCFGTLGADQQIGDGTLTLSAPLTYNDGTPVPTIASPNTMDITVDPRTPNFEVERITAYTQGSLIATVQRGIAGAAKLHVKGSGWTHDATVDDYTGVSLESNPANIGVETFGAAAAAGVLTTAARPDHVHPMPAAPSNVGGLGVYGDGSDGSPTFDGTTTVLGVAPSSNVYTMNRDWYLAASTINGGVTIRTNGYRLFCSGTLTNNGTVQFNGNAGNSNGNGGIGLSNPSSSFNTSTSGPNTLANAGGTGGTGIGGAGGNITSGSRGGAGGAGGTGVSNGGIGGSVTGPSNQMGDMRNVGVLLTSYWVSGIVTGSTPSFTGLCGGAGGGAGGGDGTNTGPGGGSGGGPVLVFVRTFAGTGAIQARGGAGAGAAAGNCGGGGGGGGGFVAVVSSSVSGGAISGQTIDANGGAGGAKTGTGVNGSAGSSGIVVLLAN